MLFVLDFFWIYKSISDLNFIKINIDLYVTESCKILLRGGDALMLVKIGDVATQYDISNQTLRYWEEVGILNCIRMDNGYRYYDDDSILRIKQIIFLRKLKLPIQDIQSIFASHELSFALEALHRHLDETKLKVEELMALSVVLEHLIKAAESQSSLSEVLISLDVSANSVIHELRNALQITLSERDSSMSENTSYSKVGNVRIVRLPKMVFACYKATSITPENDCAAVVNKFIVENSLHKKLGFRHFGFNNPDPQEGNSIYGYEMWVVVPEDYVIPEPLYRKEFKGGLFAAIPTQMTVIGERWKELWDWVFNNQKYEADWHPESDRRWLEECIDYNSFNSSEIDEEDKQLDLLAPIKLKKE